MSSPFPSFPSVQTTSRSMRPGHSVLKRALLGIFLLIVMVSGGAWLMHAGIDQEAEAQLASPDTVMDSVSSELKSTVHR
jgi:hypothetical protein